MARSSWTEEELAWLRTNYASNSIAYCAKKLQRSTNSVQLKASRLGLRSEFRWNASEVDYLTRNYPTQGTHAVAKALNLTPAEVARKAVQLKVQRIDGPTMARVWTPEEDSYLRENAQALTKFELAKKLGVDRTTLIRRARALEIELTVGKKTSTPWNPDAVEFLRQWYGKLSVHEIGQVVGKKPSSVITKACREGLGTSMTETLPERQVAYALDQLGFVYTKQAKIKSGIKHVVYKADFLLESNLVIEVQGDYYHCNPALFPQGPVNPSQVRWVAKDARKRQFYETNGYEVLEIWESDCRDMSQVKFRIQQFVQSRQALATGL